MTECLTLDPDLELPKIEASVLLPRGVPSPLHAHLTGSITLGVLQEIWAVRKATEKGFELDPPASVLGGGAGRSVQTFFPLFNSYMYALIASLDHLLLATRSVLESFADDGVEYLELRTTPRGLGTVTADGVIRAILSVIQDWNAAHPEEMWAGLILSIDRARHDLQFAENVLETALEMRDEGLPIVGLDLAGDPSKGDVRIFRPIFQRAKMLRLKVTVHFAELPDREEEMDEMMSWHPDRLGHAIHVPERLKQEIVNKKLGLEMCLSCNVLAGMLPVRQRVDDDDHSVSSSESTREGEKYASHHFGEWWRTSVPLSLNTDDVGIFHSTNSNEPHLVAKHFGLTKADLLNLSLRALEGAFGPAQVVERARGKVEAFRLGEGLRL